jgi:hypothetical protein
MLSELGSDELRLDISGLFHASRLQFLSFCIDLNPESVFDSIYILIAKFSIWLLLMGSNS